MNCFPKISNNDADWLNYYIDESPWIGGFGGLHHSPVIKWLDKYVKDEATWGNDRDRTRNTHSQMIANLKDGDQSLQQISINYFYDKLDPFLSKNAIICTMPGHKVHFSVPSGVDLLVDKIYKNNNRKRRIKCPRCGSFSALTRTKDVSKNTYPGSDRSKKKHFDSLSVCNRYIKNCNILLIDDVMTTGNSLKVGKELLLEAGANNVQCVALAQTYNERYDFQNYGKIGSIGYGNDAYMIKELKKWRLAIAKKKALPAYCICSDKTLKELYRLLLIFTKIEDLIQAQGVGEKFINNYGESLISAYSEIVYDKWNGMISAAESDKWSEEEQAVLITRNRESGEFS